MSNRNPMFKALIRRKRKYKQAWITDKEHKRVIAMDLTGVLDRFFVKKPA